MDFVTSNTHLTAISNRHSLAFSVFCVIVRVVNAPLNMAMLIAHTFIVNTSSK